MAKIESWFCVRCRDWTPTAKARCRHCGVPRSEKAVVGTIDPIAEAAREVADAERRRSGARKRQPQKHRGVAGVATTLTVMSVITFLSCVLIGVAAIAAGLSNPGNSFAGYGLFVSAWGVLDAILLRGFSGMLRVLIDVEENTRRTAEAVERLAETEAVVP